MNPIRCISSLALRLIQIYPHSLQKEILDNQDEIGCITVASLGLSKYSPVIRYNLISQIGKIDKELIDYLYNLLDGISPDHIYHILNTIPIPIHLYIGNKEIVMESNVDLLYLGLIIGEDMYPEMDIFDKYIPSIDRQVSLLNKHIQSFL